MFGRRDPRRLTELASGIAASCWEEIWSRVAPRAATMTPAEARGYIRAHARQPVTVGVELAARRLADLGAKQQEELLELAIEEVLRRSLAELVRGRRSAIQHLRGRRAAA
jgi:hypothetical protein